MTHKRAVIIPGKCSNCHPCPAAEGCSARAIKREEIDDLPFVDLACKGCGTCLKDCPQQAMLLI